MKMADLFLSELDRESARSKRALEQVPEGQHEWKPHDRSMKFGPLVEMVAMIPSWVSLALTQDELDLNPPGGPRKREPLLTREALLQAHDKAVADARTALQDKATDEYLMTPWRLLVAGQVVWEAPRHEIIRDLINHLAHHRGQMTVYLRLLGATVPALYGPSADDQRFL